jgi:hypothetical protein
MEGDKMKAMDKNIPNPFNRTTLSIGSDFRESGT